MIERKTTGEKVFTIINVFFLLFIICITLYPFLYIVAVSLSSSEAVVQNRVTVYPIGLNFDAYFEVFKNSRLWMAYKNTIIQTLVGTLFELIGVTLAAYPLSKKDLVGRNVAMMMIAFTMYFSGGLIPSYLVVRSLGLVNTIWALVIPGAVSAWHIIILRTFFQGIPKELEEAAVVDGMGDLGILTKIYLPLSLPIYATLTLFFTVGHWNAFFNALIYLNDKDKYPLQLLLRSIVLAGNVSDMSQTDNEQYVITESLKSATIIFTVLPILMVYPFIQKYFVTGVMVGSIKG